MTLQLLLWLALLLALSLLLLQLLYLEYFGAKEEASMMGFVVQDQ